jgi:DNA-dependent RNA polymerase auxiliary subunit epsilon
MGTTKANKIILATENIIAIQLTRGKAAYEEIFALLPARRTVDKKQLHLGYYTSIEDAARAYDEAAIKHFGQYALTNAMLNNEARI